MLISFNAVNARPCESLDYFNILSNENLIIDVMKYVDPSHYNTSDYLGETTPEESKDRHWKGKNGENAIYNYFGIKDEYGNACQSYLARAKRTRRFGDGGVDIRGTHIDVKTSSLNLDWNYGNWYLTRKEWHPNSIYVKLFYYQHEWDKLFENPESMNFHLKYYLWGWATSSQFEWKETPSLKTADKWRYTMALDKVKPIKTINLEKEVKK